MSIKEIMEIGCEGMSASERDAEQERRIKVSDRITLLGNRIRGGKIAARSCEIDGDKAEAKKLKAKVREWEREINRIKGAEGAWLKSAAWFMYN